MQKRTGELVVIKGSSWSLGLLLLSVAMLNGCSDVPDALNPAEWYKSTTDLFSDGDRPAPTAETAKGDQGKLAADRGKPAPGAEKPFPSLSSVPQGLSGDSQKRKYSSDALPRQGAPTEILGSAPPPPVLSSAPEREPASMPAPSMAAPKLTPPPGVMTGMAKASPPPSGGGLHETYMARLSQRLPVAGGLEESAVAPPQDNGAFPPAASAPEPTVIISSSGVDAGIATPSVEPAKPPVTLQRPKQPENEAPSGVTIQEDVISPSEKHLAPLSSEAVKVATIMFDNGSYELKTQALGVIGKVFKIYRQEGGRVRVIGHSSSRTRNMDQVRHKMVNYQFSANRADIVARELVRLGVPSTNVIVDARADTDPMYYEIMPSGEAGNRRAEVYFER